MWEFVPELMRSAPKVSEQQGLTIDGYGNVRIWFFHCILNRYDKNARMKTREISQFRIYSWFFRNMLPSNCRFVVGADSKCAARPRQWCEKHAHPKFLLLKRPRASIAAKFENVKSKILGHHGRSKSSLVCPKILAARTSWLSLTYWSAQMLRYFEMKARESQESELAVTRMPTYGSNPTSSDRTNFYTVGRFDGNTDKNKAVEQFF